MLLLGDITWQFLTRLPILPTERELRQSLLRERNYGLHPVMETIGFF